MRRRARRLPTKTRTKRANERALITFFEEQDRKIVGIMTKMLLAVGNTDRPTIKMLDNYRAQIREILKDLHEGGGRLPIPRPDGLRARGRGRRRGSSGPRH
jgi:hypothetical protein